MTEDCRLRQPIILLFEEINGGVMMHFNSPIPFGVITCYQIIIPLSFPLSFFNNHIR